MRLTIPQTQLLRTLQVVERAVNDRSTLPVLANILLETTENELILTATDLDVGIRCRFPLNPPVELGAVALPARKVTTIIRELPDELVTLEAKKNHTATIQCGTSNFRVPGLPPEDFPLLPPLQGTEGIALAQGALKMLVGQTSYAMSMEETRFILNGTLLTTRKNLLEMVATDGRRLAIANIQLTNHTREPLWAVIPAKTVRELGRLLQDDDSEDVVIAPLQENQLAFRFGFTTIITRLLDGQFPQYEKVVPPPTKHTLACNRQQLMDAIRRASLMTTAASQAVTFEVGQRRLVISKESPEIGSAREELDGTYSGEPLTVAFNPEFWLDALKTLSTPEVHIELAAADKPAVIRQPAFTYLVLPMKLS